MVLFSFDELMREFLNIFQFATESVTDYVVRLEKAFTLLRYKLSTRLSNGGQDPTSQRKIL